VTTLLHFTIDGAKVVSECAPNSTAHHMAKYRATQEAQKEAKYSCKVALAQAGIETIAAPIVLTCVRYYATRAKAYDGDALPATFKGHIDGIKKALGIDDAPAFMTIICRQERANACRLEFTIEKREASL
jgi:hypothetical protein